MRLRPLTPLRSLAGRRRVRPVRTAAQTLATARAVGRRGAAAWHVHVHRHHTHVRPRMALELTIAAGPRAADGSPGIDGTSAITRVVSRRHERTVVERRTSLLRVVRALEAQAAGRGQGPSDGRDGAPGRVVRAPAPPPPMVLRPAAVVAPDAPPPAPPGALTGLAVDDHRPSATRAPAAHAASPTSAAVAPAVDVERLAADVIDVIDRRVTAHRERLGSA